MIVGPEGFRSLKPCGLAGLCGHGRVRERAGQGVCAVGTVLGVAGGVALRLVWFIAEPFGVGREKQDINRDTVHRGSRQLACPAAHESVGLVAKTHTTGVFEFVVWYTVTGTNAPA